MIRPEIAGRSEADPTPTGREAVRFESTGDGVLRAWLDRPATRNAIDAAMVAGLEAMVDRAERECPKLVVIRGSGGTFCAGADLDEVERLLDRPGDLREFMVRLGSVFDRLEAAPWVSLAVVEGFALAGGCELLLACDLVLVAADARIGDRHTEYALAPAAGGSVRLLEALPPAQAKRLLLGGEMITGSEAAAIGLVSLAVPPDALDAELGVLVERLRTRGSGSLATIKTMAAPPPRLARRRRLDRELDLFLQHAASGEMRAGLRAFRERRTETFD